MSRLCSVCQHPQREAIDLALALHDGGYRDIARRFHSSRSSLCRHERKCLRSSWGEARKVNAMLRADTLLEELGAWHARMLDQYDHADAAGNITAAVATAKVGIQAIESFSRIGVMSELEKRLAQLEQGKDGEVEEEGE
jgi:hypothetical protein